MRVGTRNKMTVTTIIFALLCVALAAIMIGSNAISSASLEAQGFAPNETISLNIGGTKKDINVASSNINPMTLAEGEESWGVVKITEFNIAPTTNETIVYSTKWIYTVTPARAESKEYVFTRSDSGETYTLASISVGGGTEIPVNGIVVSTKNGEWDGATVGLTLTKNSTFSFPRYAGAVEIAGSGTYAGATNKNIRIALTAANKRRDAEEIVYYNNEWGKNSNANEFGTEAKMVLNEQGQFEITEIRNVRDTNQLNIEGKSFVLSIHGAYRVFLANNLFTKVGDKANLVGMKFVDLNKSASNNLTTMNPTSPVKPTDLDELNGNKYYPGFRAPDYLMYYDANYIKSTDAMSSNFPNYSGANEWGYEILVTVKTRTGSGDTMRVQGEVVSAAKQIPTLLANSTVGGAVDSFVLSGNGIAETFLTQNSLTGADVVVEKVSGKWRVTVTSTSLSYISVATYRYEVANDMMTNAIDAKYKLNYIGAGDSTTNNKWTRKKAEFDKLLGNKNDTADKDTLWGVRAKIESFTGSEQALNVEIADFNFKYLTLLNHCNYIEAMSYANPSIMSIAAWHRPNLTTENNLAGIKNTLNIFKKANLNTVYLETFWNGYSMSNGSEYVDYHKDFVTNTYTGYKDYLDCFVAEAHKLGIEVHAWVEDFFVGYEGFTESNVLTGKKPNSTEDASDKAKRAGWVIKDYQNNEYTQFEGGKYKFIDPSNPEVRKFLNGYFSELMTEYDLDGINLDYIRYPVQNSYGHDKNNVNVPFDHGYSEFAAAKFLAEQNYPVAQQNLTTLKSKLSKIENFPDAATALKAEWDKFKIRQINEFVAEVKATVNAVDKTRQIANAKPSSQASLNKYTKKRLIISTAIFAGNSALTQKSQDWESWVKAGHIEVTTPMSYYTNNDTVRNEITKMINRINGLAFNYAGIAPYFMGLAPIQEVNQALSALAGGAFGTVIFDSKSLLTSTEVVDLLSSGIYGNQAILPHEEVDILLAKFSDEMKSRADLYGITGAKLTAYNAKFDALKNMGYSNSNDLLALMRESLFIQENVDLYASGHAQTRIVDEMKNLNNILMVTYNRMVNGYREQEVDKTALSAKIAEANVLKAEGYTVISWATMQEVLANAIALNSDSSATQKQIDDAAASLTNAINSLVVKVAPPKDAGGCNGSISMQGESAIVAMILLSMVAAAFCVAAKKKIAKK